MCAAANDKSSWPDTGRHRLEAQLGRGGMGAVYRAVELSSGRVVALKALERTEAHVRALFEREYHTLASIQHPCVIEVYEFGHSRDGQRYYTMELLDGHDLRSLVPLPWRELCRHARAVAASLSLLHARRLLHRDVSPANIRIGASGRAKLIDFGALSSFGPASELVGTPKCMAPEAQTHRTLDGRADIFSLGVVMYFGLTGVLPFSGHSPFASGTETSPRAPAELVPHLPDALDKLVMSMLQFDPRARPATCAEVIERIEACMGETDELEHAVAEGHLRSAAFCGRARELGQLQRHLDRTLRGQGGTVTLEGAQGMGRSRLADELLIHAQLRGLASVRVDAAAHPGPTAVMAAIVRAVRSSVPAEANETLTPFRQALSELLQAETSTGSEVHETKADATGDPTERRAQRQMAVVRWLLAVADRVPLVIVADNLESCDESSAGALAALAHEASRHRLLLCCTRAQGSAAPIAVDQLERLGARIKLRGLSSTATAELVAGVFGDVPGCDRLAQWVHTVGQGNPARAMELLAHLAARGAIRYVGGTWILPARLADEDLPASFEDALQARVEDLQPLGRRMAQLFALHQGALSLALCQELIRDADPGVIYRTLDELVAADMLTASGQTYRLRHPGLRAPLLATLDPAERKALHLTLAEALLSGLSTLVGADSVAAWQAAQTPILNRALQAGWHCLHGGDDERAQRLLRNAGIELTRRGDGLPEAIPALEAALETYDALGRSRYEQGYLLVPLTLAGGYSDFRICARYADRVLQTLLDVSGLSLANRLRPWLGERISLWLSLALGSVRFYLTQRRKSCRTYRESVLGVIGIGSAILGAAVPLLDRQWSTRTLALLQPLAGFPSGHPARITHEFQLALHEATWGRYDAAAERGHRVLQALRKPGGLPALPEGARVQLVVGVLILLGSLDSTRLDGRVHLTIELLDALRTAVSRQTRVGSLASYHANRGERPQFLTYQREVDVLAAQLGSTWRQDVLMPRNLWWTYALCEDVMGLKRVMRQLETIVNEAPSLADSRDASIACYLAQRGRAAEALERFGPMFERTAREGTAMALRHAGAYARVLRLSGRAKQALELCESVLRTTHPAQLEFGTVSFGLELEHCLATHASGSVDLAAGMIDALLAGMATHDNPLLHGLAHRARAEIALDQRDERAFEEHRAATDRWFARTDNPALLAIVRELSHRGVQRGVGRAKELASSPPSDLGVLAVSPRVALNACHGADERVHMVLELLLSASGAERGYLYVLEPGGLRFAAPAVGEEPPESLAVELAAHLATANQNQAASDDVTVAVANDNALDPEALGAGPRRDYMPLLLETLEGDRVVRVGVAALWPGESPLVAVPAHHLQEIAQALYFAGDFRTVYLAEPVQTGEPRCSEAR